MMKSALKILAIACLLTGFTSTTKACEIIVSVDGTKKENYKAGDVVVIKVTVVLKHRNCDVDINKTAINVSGSQMTGATKWVNTDGNTWERKIKVKILKDLSNKAIIVAERTCDRDGGKGSLTLTTA
jgi:hypothetical protein